MTPFIIVDRFILRPDSHQTEHIQGKILVNLQVSALFYLILTDLVSGEIKYLLQQRVPDPICLFNLSLSIEDTGKKLSVRTKQVISRPTTQIVEEQLFRQRNVSEPSICFEIICVS